MVRLIILINFIIHHFKCYLIALSNDQSSVNYELEISLNEYENDGYFAYGVWTRYLPLSGILQIEEIQIFNHICYNIHNAIDILTNQVNFLYYDCINLEEKTITKTIQFIDEKCKQYNYQIKIEVHQYEYCWYYFQIIQWPQQFRLELCLVFHQSLIFHQIAQIQYPYSSKNQMINFGGDLIIQGTQLLQTQNQLTFYSFPGIMYIYPLDIGKIAVDDNPLPIIIDTFSLLYQCHCNSNDIIPLSMDFSQQDLFLYTSNNQYCDQYTLSGWMKIIEITKVNGIFSFLFLKMCANSENSQITNQNLCAFQLFFDITNDFYKIRITTYNYQLPLINQDFTSNQNLIIHEFKIINIFSWIQLQLVLIQNDFTILLNYYENNQIVQQKFTQKVNHFHLVQFKILFGNILQSKEDLIKVKIYNFLFNNCLGYFIENLCDSSCLTCDGPTKNDCLSCDIDQNRIYLKEQKTCICPYGYIDNLTCQNYQNYNFQIDSTIQDQSFKCEYGYFEVDQTCIQCPSVIQRHLITCLECVYNPKSWIYDSFCKTYLVLDDIGSPYQIINELEIFYYIFDGESLNLCEDCPFQNNILDNYNNNRFKSIYFKQFCQYTSTEYTTLHFFNSECYNCSDVQYCIRCQITFFGLYCLECDYQATLQDGFCISDQEIGLLNQQSCRSPYYTNSKKACSFCPIKNCIYCFEFYSNDLTYCTLYQNFIPFDVNEYHSIGCALCEPKYIFDFTKGQCIEQNPQIENCSRSYINLNGIEICTLSQIQDFKIAPEIEFCQQKISKCQQCIQTPKQQIKCILCEEGYSASITTGQCSICQINHAKICIQGNSKKMDAWVQLIQSFMMKFLPNQYYYPTTFQTYFIYSYPIICEDGFIINIKGHCIPNCDSNCQQCENILSNKQASTCKYCGINYYNQPLRSSDKGICYSCPQLCEVCTIRTQEEIQSVNPFFIVSDENQIFTQKCLKQVNEKLIYESDSNKLSVTQQRKISNDPYQFISKYCFDHICSHYLNFNVEITEKNFYNVLQSFLQEYYENQIDFYYCNSMGIEKLKINLHFNQLSKMRKSWSGNPTQIYNNLKSKIFSLKNVLLIMEGEQDDENIIPDSLNLNNFDLITINGLNFQSLNNNFTFNFINEQNYLILLEFTNIRFFSYLQEQTFKIQTSNLKIKNFKSVNFRITDMIIKNSIIFSLDAEIIQIIFMEIVNCTFYNVTFLQLINSEKISINQLNILNSTLIQSNFIVINRFQQNQFDLGLDQLIIQNNYFENSTFFSFFEDFQTQFSIILIQNQLICKNEFINSSLFSINKNITILNLTLNYNQFINSIIFHTSNTFKQDYLIFIFQNFYGYQNDFSNSIIIQTVINNKLSIQIQKFIFNDTKSPTNQSEFLFQIKCTELNVQNFFMFENFNLRFFSLYQTSTINFKNIELRNSDVFQKILFSYDCYSFKDFGTKFLQIIGFTNLILSDISLCKQFNFDTSLISILSDIIYNQENDENILIKNITITQCVLLKKKLGNLLSLIAIFSEKRQSIQLQDINLLFNSFHQYVDDLSQLSAGLLFIGSLQSQVHIESLECDSNYITNSSISFMAIQSLIVSITKFRIQNHNYQFDHNWKKTYKMFFNSQDEYDSFFLFNSIFVIENIGVFSIAATNFTMNNGLFKNISAYSSAVLEIKTQGIGQVKLEQLNFDTISADLSQTVDLNGCISIYSKNSQLNFQLSYVTFNQVFNNLGSAIFSIVPSEKKNIINFDNVQIINCISFTNMIIRIQFPVNIKIENKVKMTNIQIIATLDEFIKFLNKLSNFVMQDIKKINIDNAIFNLKNCDLYIQNLNVQGISFSPILLLQDISFLVLSRIQLFSIQQFYRSNLLLISQQKSTTQSIIISKLTMQNVSMISLNDDLNLNQNNKQLRLSFQKCNINLTSTLQNLKVNISSMLAYFNQLNQDETTIFSLFQLYSDSEVQKIFISEFNLILNNCSSIKQNGIQLILSNFLVMRINELNCQQNIFFQNGCLTFQNLNRSQVKPEILISSSSFIRNLGGSGVGIFSNFINLKLINCIFVQNNSTNQGGAIYFGSQQEDIIVTGSIIINNTAKSGGGIYFNGSTHFSNKNFQRSLLKFNQASNNANNIKEYPIILCLLINNQEMTSEQISINKQTIEQLYIKPYKILQQGRLIKTEFLLFPSDQQIKNFKIYSFKAQQFIQYINEISLIFKNSYGELIIEDSNILCSIQQNIISNQTIKKIAYFENLFLSSPTDKIQFESFNFKFDPYSSDNTYSQLQIKCSLDNNTNQLIYWINSKSFMCQLGEFYVDEGCQICESNQGYYTVNYNVTKCSIFDKAKFKSITSNRIEILPGYWRPHLLSDFTEACFKYAEFCQGGWGTGDQLCSLGHIGGLCEECDIYDIKGNGKYFRNQQDYRCNSCFEFQTSIFPFFLSLLWSLLSIILTLRSVEKSNSLYTSLRLRQKFYKILFPLNQDHESILLKMLINYVWIFSVILTFNIHFQISFKVADSTANPIQYMTTSLDCYLINISQIEIIYTKVIFMITLILTELWIITILYIIISKFRSKRIDESIISTTAIYLYVSNHASLIKNFCSLLSSRNISGIDFIQGDVSYFFETYNHKKWIQGFILPGLGIFGFLIPLILFLSIYIQRKKLDQIEIRKYICYLFNEYKQNSYFWEQIKIWKKTIIIIILTQFETENLIKVSLLGICLLFYTILAAKFMPYHIKNLNRIDVESGQICTFAIFLAAFIYKSDQENIEYQIFLQTLLMLLFVRLCIPFLHAAFRVYYKKYKITIISLIINFLKKLRISTFFLSQQLNLWQDKDHQLKNNIEKLRRYLLQVSKVQLDQQKLWNSQPTPTSPTISQRSKFISMMHQSQKLF